MATVQLILDIDEEVVERAKKYAEAQHTDLKRLVEVVLQDMVNEPASENAEEKPLNIRTEPHQFSPWLQQLILSKEPTPDFDHKAEYHKHLEEKYGL